jgi:ABC-type cobalamin/Fe3+-siderophores transport system ATPase subunit
MARLDKLVVENYRGASVRLELDFETSKPVALLFGENGTGKTTIADALDAVGNSSKGSLEDKSSTRARDHLPTIGKKPADVRIEVTMGASVWQTSLAGDNLTTNPPTPPRIRVLRRSQLQRLIQAQPAKRYEELRRFIDVDKVERSENALRDAASSVNTALTAASEKRVEAELQLQKAWEEEGKPGADALIWANGEASQDAATLNQQVQQLREAQTSITKAENALAELKQATSAAKQHDAEAQAIEQEVAKLQGIDAKQAISLVGILNHVRQHLAAGTHPEECPVCRQAIPLADLRADVEARLVELQQYDALRLKRDSARGNVQISQQAVATKRSALLTSSRVLLETQKERIKSVSDFGTAAKDYAELAKQSPGDIELAVEQAEHLVGASSSVKQKLSDTEIATTKRSGQISLISGHYKQVQESIAKTVELAKLQPLLQKAYDIARLARIVFTQKILDSVATECNRLYAIVHPNEALAISKLALDQGRRASLDQAASFEGHCDVPPQAYFSESHLDTLGFCFWLAMAKLESPKADAIVVLDDVFTSVDASHLGRIAQLITDESSHFGHIIVTTHQRLWRDIYRYQHGAGKLTQIVELQRWSLAKGISNYKTRLAVDELIASIAGAPFDRQVTALRAGVLLEAMLDYLALQYRCRVARSHDGSYTLGELLDGTESLLKKLQVYRPDLDGTGKPYSPPKYLASTAIAIAQQIRGLAFLRSQVGAHFNVAGSVVSDADVQKFADLTVKLAASLSCATCGQIPGKRTAVHFQCSCAVPNEVHMLPLQH